MVNPQSLELATMGGGGLERSRNSDFLGVFALMASRPEVMRQLKTISGQSLLPMVFLDQERAVRINPLSVRQAINHDNLYEASVGCANFYNKVNRVLTPVLREDVNLIWQIFQGNKVSLTNRFQFSPDMARVLEGERILSPKHRRVYEIFPMSSVMPLVKGGFSGNMTEYEGQNHLVVSENSAVLCQDFLVIIDGAERDPFNIPAKDERLVVGRIESFGGIDPLLAWVVPFRKKDLEMMWALTGKFVDAVVDLNEPLTLKVLTGGWGRSVETTGSYAEFLRRGASGGLLNTGMVDGGWGSLPDSMAVQVFPTNDVNLGTSFYSGLSSHNSIVSLDMRRGDLLKMMLEMVERPFLRNLAVVQEQASLAQVAFVDSVLQKYPQLRQDMAGFEALSVFANIVFDTWVTSLLILWQDQFARPTADSLR